MVDGSAATAAAVCSTAVDQPSRPARLIANRNCNITTEELINVKPQTYRGGSIRVRG